MRVSYGLITQFAREGDIDALNVMTQWEKLGNPQSPIMKTEAHFQEGPGFFLYTPQEQRRSLTMPGMPLPPTTSRHPTLLGMARVYVAPDVIITDNDGDPDGEE